MRFRQFATSVLAWIGVAIALVAIAYYTCGGTQCVLGEVTTLELESWLKTFLPKIATLVVVFFLFKILSKLIIDGIYRKVYLKAHNEIEFFAHSKLLKFGWWFAYAILAFGLFFRNIGALLTSLGLIGFGITFALQKPILNFVGWMTIISTKTYTIGDRIKVGDVRGDVIDIQVMNTVVISLLETSDVRSDKVVTIPNEFVLTGAVENYTKSSNFIVNELEITITYESDYREAVKLMQSIAEEQTRRNIHLFRQRLSTRRVEIDRRINRLTRRFLQASDDDREVQKDIQMLERERKGLDTMLGDVKEQFKPKVRMELKDSAIALIVQFYCPYNATKKNRTEINMKFLDAVRNRKDVDIAYPHVQIVGSNDQANAAASAAVMLVGQKKLEKEKKNE